MVRPNIKHTTVNLYEDDVEFLRQKGIPISDALRELVHYLCVNDMTDILKSVRYGQLFTQLNNLQEKLENAKAAREHLDKQITEYESGISFVLACQKDYKLIEDNQEKFERICEIGKVIDLLMYRCNFNIKKMREADIPELREMEEINPGWDLEEHVRMRKSVGDGSVIPIL